MRCKFREQASTAIPCQASGLSYTLTRFQQWVAGKTRMASLVVLLGLGGGLWVTTEVMAPQIAQAETKSVDLSLERQPNETYETLLRRAEEAARVATQASFEQDMRVTDVSVTILAQNKGAIAPVLSLEVSRSQWLSRPDVQSWVTYFTSARALLQFEDVATTAPSQPGTTNPTTTPGQTTNSTFARPRTTNPTTTSGETTNSTFARPRTTNPISTPGQTTNSTPGQLGTTNPTTTPSQTPQPGTGMSPLPPTAAPVTPSGNTQSPSLPNVNQNFPSTSTPTSGSQNPLAVPSTSGTTINNSTPTSVPNSNGNILNNNSVTTPTTPNGTSSGSPQLNTPGNLNNTIPSTTQNLNDIPNATSSP